MHVRIVSGFLAVETRLTSLFGLDDGDLLDLDALNDLLDRHLLDDLDHLLDNLWISFDDGDGVTTPQKFAAKSVANL